MVDGELDENTLGILKVQRNMKCEVKPTHGLVDAADGTLHIVTVTLLFCRIFTAVRDSRAENVPAAGKIAVNSMQR